MAASKLARSCDVSIVANHLPGDYDTKEWASPTWRLQCVVAKTENYNRLFIRRGPNGYYSTAFSRMDGTAYCGGILTDNDSDTTVPEEQRATVKLMTPRFPTHDPDGGVDLHERTPEPA